MVINATNRKSSQVTKFITEHTAVLDLIQNSYDRDFVLLSTWLCSEFAQLTAFWKRMFLLVDMHIVKNKCLEKHCKIHHQPVQQSTCLLDLPNYGCHLPNDILSLVEPRSYTNRRGSSQSSMSAGSTYVKQTNEREEESEEG